MSDHVDRIPALQLTLEDSLRVTVEGRARWAPVLGLTRAGDLVVVTCGGLDRALALSADVPVVVLRSDASAYGDDAEVDAMLSGAYAGDLAQAGEAVTEHTRLDGRRGAPPAASRPSSFARDPELVGIYGGDLDHVVDAIGAGAPDEQARSRRAEVQRTLAAARHEPAPQVGQAEADEITEAVEARMAGWYAGDADYVREHRDDR